MCICTQRGENDEMLDEFDSNAPKIRKCKIHSDSSFDLAGNVGWCFWSRTKTIQHHPTWFFPSFFFFRKFRNLSTASNISSNIRNLRSWMRCWIHLRPPPVYAKWYKHWMFLVFSNWKQMSHLFFLTLQFFDASVALQCQNSQTTPIWKQNVYNTP